MGWGSEEQEAHLAREFEATDLALFGSVARDEAREGSDIDIVVQFDGPATSKRCFGVQFYLEVLLGCPTDLVTDNALRKRLPRRGDDHVVSQFCTHEISSRWIVPGLNATVRICSIRSMRRMSYAAGRTPELMRAAVADVRIVDIKRAYTCHTASP